MTFQHFVGKTQKYIASLPKLLLSSLKPSESPFCRNGSIFSSSYKTTVHVYIYIYIQGNEYTVKGNNPDLEIFVFHFTGIYSQREQFALLTDHILSFA